MIRFLFVNKWTGSFCVIATVIAFSSMPHSSYGAGYLKIGDIKGESTDADHKDWINLLSISQSMTRPGNTSTGTSATLGDIVCVKEVDASTPKLMEAVARGTAYPSVVIELTRTVNGKRVPYLLWELKQVRVTSYSISGATDGSIPMVELSLNFEEIKVVYNVISDIGEIVEPIEFQHVKEKDPLSVITR